MKIKSVRAREILDSRANPTIETTITVEKGKETFAGRASVPSGASKGKHEAKELRDGGQRFGGKGVRKAVDKINGMLNGKLKGKQFASQKELDDFLIKLDGTQDKSNLGANTMLSISIAGLRARAAIDCTPTFQEINKNAKLLPVPLANLINGGMHAGGAIAFQEYMVIPSRARNLQDAVQAAGETYRALRELLRKKYGARATLVGDEGGFVPPVTDVVEPLALIRDAAKEAGWSDEIDLGLDCAASSFFSHGKYNVQGKIFETGPLLDFYEQLVKTFRISYLEDPFQEEDFSAFAALNKKIGSRALVTGDDLVVSQTARLQMAISQKSVGGIILKPNQVGTISEAIATAELAKRNGIRVIASHRSGETNDDFISDFAVALECGFAKIGAPARGERVAKYNRLLDIERFLEGKARFARVKT
ncbi:MAG TPA: phosphopyruvate hydratase [Candidatus Norongarragalinales archaeon]|jgi:enolase|nr:phosphopyruvate hydratase [Candidatus Norongarragalinales archaeon]